MKKLCLFGLLSSGVLFCSTVLSAQESQPSTARKAQMSSAPAAADSAGDLAKATQNPVASLINVPIQNNSNFAVGPYNLTQNVLNIQPVIPAHLSENWMPICANHSAYSLAAHRYSERWRSIWIWGYEPDLLPLPSKPRQADLGARSGNCPSYRYEYSSRSR
jgi:hypothetical protein